MSAPRLFVLLAVMASAHARTEAALASAQTKAPAQTAPRRATARPTTAPLDAELKAVERMMESDDQLAAAESALRRILARSNSPEARDLLGVVLGRLGRPAEAEQQFAHVLEAAPGRTATRQHLARLRLAQGQEAEATVELRRAARAAPLDRDLALALARMELAAGNVSEADRLLRITVERHRSVRALLQLAQIKARSGNAPASLELLRRALDLAPNSEELLSAYAQTSLAAHAPVPAIMALEPLVRMNPTVAQHAYLFGVALMQAGDMPSAIEALEQAERLEPQRPLTLIALGFALNAQKRYGEAKPFLARSLQVEPDNVEAVAALAESEEGLDELAPAEEHAQRAVGRSPDHGTGNLVLGMVRMKQERYSEARAALEKAVASEPDSPKAHYQLSLACARLGDSEASQRHVDKYQQAQRQREERVKELHNATGAPEGTTPR